MHCHTSPHNERCGSCIVTDSQQSGKVTYRKAKRIDILLFHTSGGVDEKRLVRQQLAGRNEEHSRGSNVATEDLLHCTGSTRDDYLGKEGDLSQAPRRKRPYRR